MRESLLKSLPSTCDRREYPRQLKLSLMEVIENEFTEALLDFFEEQQDQRLQDEIDSYIDSYADED